jgi:hypothetical protein
LDFICLVFFVFSSYEKGPSGRGQQPGAIVPIATTAPACDDEGAFADAPKGRDKIPNKWMMSFF